MSMVRLIGNVRVIVSVKVRLGEGEGMFQV